MRGVTCRAVCRRVDIVASFKLPSVDVRLGANETPGDAVRRASPGRCGAQCKTWARGPMQDLSAVPKARPGRGAQCKTWARYPKQDLGAGPNARPRRGVPLSSDFVTTSCSLNRVTIVVERIYTVCEYVLCNVFTPTRKALGF